MSIRIGIIGGSGLYDMAELGDREEGLGRLQVARLAQFHYLHDRQE